jgi:hypothetical protein
MFIFDYILNLCIININLLNHHKRYDIYQRWDKFILFLSNAHGVGGSKKDNS